MRLFAALLVVLFFFVPAGRAQDKTYTAVRISGEKPGIDGIFDEGIWDQAVWEDDFIQLKPFEKRPPRQKTAFKILYDNDNIYVAIKAYDTAVDSIVRRMARRDEFEGDYVGIGFDSYHDLRSAFVFVVNAAGVKVDAAVTEDGGQWDYNWDPVWYVKTTADASGWNAEMQIPLTQLRFGKQVSYTWGLQVGRHLFRYGEESAWKFISSNAPGWVSFFGELHGIQGINPKKQKDITPYVVTSLERYEKGDEDPFLTGKGSRISGGLDGKFGLTNDLTLDLTINPDFGQIEADPSVVNLTAFETYYEEKRPFFIEGRNIMTYIITSGGPLSGDNLFYSRRIGRSPHIIPETDDGIYVKMPANTAILGAFKITGKTRKGWSVGILDAVTRRETAVIDSFGRLYRVPVEPLTNYSLLRIKKDLNEGNTRIGGMLTSTNRNIDDPYMNELRTSGYTGGIDFYHQWNNKTFYFNAKSIFSYISGSKEAILETQTAAPRFFQRPGAPHLSVDSSLTSLTGFGGTLTGGRAGNSKWPFLIWLTWRSPSLELNDIGYQYTPDILQEVIWIGYQNFEQTGIFRDLYVGFSQWYGTTFGLEKVYLGANIESNANFTNYWHAYSGISFDTWQRSTSDLRGGPALVYSPTITINYNLATDSRKKLIFSCGGTHNIGTEKQFNYMNFYAGLTWRASKALRIELTPRLLINNNHIAYVNNIEDSVAVDHYIRGSLNQIETSLTIRLTYNITPDFTIQYYGMPFVSAGDYSNYKYITNASAGRFYDRYNNFLPGQITEMGYNDEITYSVNTNNDGREDYSFDNPDFNTFEYRSNLIARWEYNPGSTVFLVWSFTQSRYKNEGSYSFSEDMGEIFRIKPHHVFLVKISCRFGL